jgi:hypothetical protein
MPSSSSAQASPTALSVRRRMIAGSRSSFLSKPAEDATDTEVPNRSSVEVAAQDPHGVLAPVVRVPRSEAGAGRRHQRAHSTFARLAAAHPASGDQPMVLTGPHA